MKAPLRVKKLVYVTATCACMAATAGISAWGWRVPKLPSMDSTISNRRVKDLQVPLEANRHEPTRDAFVAVLNLPLRRPLYDPPPPKPEVRQLPPLQVELLGTIIEPENSMAIVRTAQGAVEYKRRGDLVGPAESPASIVEIQGNSIVVERDDERVTLAVRTRDIK